MTIASDIAVDASGNIYYTGAVHGVAGAGYYTVIELHRFLQDLADDASASGDDLIDITSETPSDRSTDNIITLKTGYVLDDSHGSATEAISEHLYDGSIVQEDDGTIYDGLVVIAAEGMDLQIIQDGAIVTNDFWNSIPNGESTKGLNRDVANGISHRFMLMVNNAGTPIDGRRIIGITREIGYTYSEFKVNGTARGNNVLALTYAVDLNDTTDASGRSTITNETEGYALLDIDGDSTAEPYYSEWNRATYTINEFYERMKWLTECASGDTAGTPNGTLYGLDGNMFRGITHKIPYSSLSGTFDEGYEMSWSGTNSGTGQVLADNGSDTLWIQILTGVAPANGDSLSQSSPDAASATAGTPVEQTVTTPFCGSSTGSALIGAYGFGMETSDTSSADLFTDLDGNNNTPPNNVTFTVGGIVSGEDRVLVGPEDGSGGLRSDQGQLNGALSGGESSIQVNSNTETLGTGQPSATDTPTSGTIRVLGDDGVFHRVTYTGYTAGSGSLTFTGCTGAPAASASNDVFISYIDKLAASTSEAFTVVFSAIRSLFIRVRDGGTTGDNEGIKTFETTGSLGSAGGSTTVIRTSDV